MKKKKYILSGKKSILCKFMFVAKLKVKSKNILLLFKIIKKNKNKMHQSEFN